TAPPIWIAAAVATPLLMNSRRFIELGLPESAASLKSLIQMTRIKQVGRALRARRETSENSQATRTPSSPVPEDSRTPKRLAFTMNNEIPPGFGVRLSSAALDLPGTCDQHLQ